MVSRPPKIHWLFSWQHLSKDQWHKGVTPFCPFWSITLLRQSVTEHLGLRKLSLSLAIDIMGYWMDLTTCLLESPHISEYFHTKISHSQKNCNYIFLSLTLQSDIHIFYVEGQPKILHFGWGVLIWKQSHNKDEILKQSCKDFFLFWHKYQMYD